MSMKLLPILGALFLSASPAFADDMLYLVCKAEGTNKRTSLPSGQIIEDKSMVSYLMLQIDLKGKKLRNHRDPTWVGISVKGDIIIESRNIQKDGLTARLYAEMPLNPPGPFLVDNWFRNKLEYQVIKVKGDCRNSTELVWDKVVNQ